MQLSTRHVSLCLEIGEEGMNEHPLALEDEDDTGCYQKKSLFWQIVVKNPAWGHFAVFCGIR